MKVSIVTVSFNQARFLEEAILSVIGQDHPEIDYIVVDPGSTDGSREILERYRSRIAKIILDPDRGPADGLNRGFAEATGEALGFINADDFLLPGALRKVTEFFDAHPHCDMVMGNGFIVDEGRRARRHVVARNFTLRRQLHDGARWLQQSTFVRRQPFLRSPGFNIANRTCWDSELFTELVKGGAVVGYLSADLAGFRIHGESISGTGRVYDLYLEDRQRIFQQITGRKWRVTDEGLRSIYRCEGLLLRAWQWLKSPRKGMESV